MNTAPMLLVTVVVAGALAAPAHAEGPASAAAEPSRRVMRAMIDIPLQGGAVDSDDLATQRGIDEMYRLQQPAALTLSPALDRTLDRLFGASDLLPSMDRSAELGLALFGAATILAAHTPRALRPLFDGPVHLGPAMFRSGAMGAGLSGRF